jgi:hypothetical protein
MKLHEFIVYLGTGVIVIAFILNLLYFKTNKPAYFKYIFCFIVLGLLISCHTFLTKYNCLPNNFFLGILPAILLALQTICISLCFLNEHIVSKKIFFTATSVFILFFLLSIILIYLRIGPYLYYSLSLSLSQFMFLIYVVFYLRKLLNSIPIKKLKYDSFFWIVVGLLFFSACSFPVNILLPFIEDKMPESISDNIFSITNMSLIVFYLFIFRQTDRCSQIL